MSDKVAPCPVTNGVTRAIDNQKPPDCSQDCCKNQNSTDMSNTDMGKCPIMSGMIGKIQENGNGGQTDSPANVSDTSTTVASCNSCSKSVPTKPVRSSSGYALFQDSNAGLTSGNRKTSNISNISMTSSSAGSDETDEKKLDLRCLIESVGTLLIPVTGFMYRALNNLLNKEPSSLKQLMSTCSSATGFEDKMENIDMRHQPVDECSLLDIISHSAQILQMNDHEFMRHLGEEYFRLCLLEYGDAIRMMGSNILEFFSNLDGLQTYITLSEKFKSQVPPSSRCEYENNKMTLHFYTDKRELLEYYGGIVAGISKYLFQREAEVTVSCSNTPGSLHHIISVKVEDERSTPQCKICSPQESASKKASDSKISTTTFCKTFPFHFIIDKNLDIIQIGEALCKHVNTAKSTSKKRLSLHFEVLRPRIEPLTYSALLSHVNFMFNLRTKQADKHCKSQTMELKGQMIQLPEIDGILFLGTPSVEKLDELIEKGLYISDLPIHDATRDVILVGEQTKAQDGLRRRMEDLKKNIIEASAAVEEEKRKNVELLRMVFPSNIAEKLWRNEKIEPQCIDNVTILFSDIVGFTSICSSCTPMDVINMLNSLYTNFDNCCGFLDVYKVETIGDAYCVAAGLQRPSKYHAMQIAWMAIKMMEFASQQKSHDGKVIQMRIGLHTGNVLAGVVGVTMPRYCLFGNNVTLANKLESGSEATKINASPTTARLLYEGFKLTPRPRECLPQGFPSNIEGTCHFVDTYQFPFTELQNDLTTAKHIELAVKHYKINEIN
ncbi:guanylate cyclase soluble subunit alpha-1-like [Mercenaria mercenaria]|uniref:guanylate cyclase soluble subunit alpha-1-like n=1 Tax=Mercenaria mercenaria TaxID=6596 RepID=UPI00234EDAF7|nr:guanylate cyclase soluble subunit alpha-1-like [Mercenaria mercenaria]XP_045204957.2 guanylate cyclase soluble subunit alpha-1-like [Mercenaria mercenaria]